MNRYVKGIYLTEAQRDEALAMFANRHTGEHPGIGMPGYETHATDAEWLDDHSFCVRKNGHLAERHAMPAIIATA